MTDFDLIYFRDNGGASVGGNDGQTNGVTAIGGMGGNPSQQISTTVSSGRPQTNFKAKRGFPRNNNRYDPMGRGGGGGNMMGTSWGGQPQQQQQMGGGPYGMDPFQQGAYGMQQQQYPGYDPYYGQAAAYNQAAMYGGQYDQQQQSFMYGQQQQPQGLIPGDGIIPPESPKGGHVVYVYGIGQRATQQELVQLFSQFGRVLRVDIIIDFNTGLCKGFAFVAMERYQDAQMAIQNLNRAPFHGRPLQVRFKTN
ncbi:unnamed protein product [Didymodactylos carnosus]|uniref:RRM domain-containing protein n=1 Tax=Didymodactylos carnosus TaxID=1234261 RepID=A0A813WQA6_9BILA|nr:unnamed protein product [Didymodactylos carnosus]CAF1118653.1 unnamed protein product [Didymodactylos carnosus]CAF3649156.1 unnamed protein product [Didymodactylos carnosus]CAF3890952.1 unnamed protein product [Didymodactylos carnosus]